MDGNTLEDECKAPRRAIESTLAAALAFVAVRRPAEPGRLNGREVG